LQVSVKFFFYKAIDEPIGLIIYFIILEISFLKEAIHSLINEVRELKKASRTSTPSIPNECDNEYYY